MAKHDAPDEMAQFVRGLGSPPSDAEVDAIRKRYLPAPEGDAHVDQACADVRTLLAKLDSERTARETAEAKNTDLTAELNQMESLHGRLAEADDALSSLRTSLAAAVGELAKVRGQLADALKCSTCGGDPQSHPSGKECICAGDGEAEAGTRDGEVMGLRLALYDEQHRNDMSATPPPATEGREESTSSKDRQLTERERAFVHGVLDVRSTARASPATDEQAGWHRGGKPLCHSCGRIQSPTCCKDATDEQAGERDAFADELRAAIGLLEVERAKWEAADNWGAHAIVAARILDAKFYLERYEAARGGR